MYTSETKIRVRYSETDKMKYVYYGNYATYYEVGRVEALRQLGISYKSLEENGIMMPVLENHSKFIKAAVYDDLLTIKVSIPMLPSVRISFNYDIYNEENTLLHKGETTLAFVDINTGRPCRPPEEMLQLLKPFY